MNYEPLISIITLTYNHENYIAECIESVLCQTYENWEMIILDDASTDKTPFIVEEYAKKDKRIKFIRNEKNNGPTNLDVNYNTALKEAKGEWIGYLEGDDVFTKRSLEHRVKALNKLNPTELSNTVLVHGNCGRIWMDSGILDLMYNPYKSYTEIMNNNPVGSALMIFLQGINFIPASTVLIKSESLKKIGGFKKDIQGALFVDYQTWCYLALEGRFLFVDKILYFWRRHNKSVSMNYHKKLNEIDLEFIDQFYIKNREKLNDLYPKKCLGFQNKLGLAKIYIFLRAILQKLKKS